MQAVEPRRARGAGYSSILYPTDLAIDGLGAFAHALRLAYAGPAALAVLHVSGGSVAWGAYPSLRTTLTRWGALPEGAPREALAELGIQASKVRLEARNPSRGILHRARDGRADLLVLTHHHRRGLQRLLRGSVSETVVARSPIPCLVLPPGTKGFVHLESGQVRLRRALVVVPAGPGGLMALDALRRLTATLGIEDLEVELLFVDGPDLGAALQGGLPPGWRVQSDRGAGGVERAALGAIERRRPDLVVLSKGAGAGLFGVSRAVRLLRRLSVPALLAPVGSGP